MGAEPEWSKLPETLTGLRRADQKARGQSKADCDREQRRDEGDGEGRHQCENDDHGAHEFDFGAQDVERVHAPPPGRFRPRIPEKRQAPPRGILWPGR